MEGVTKSLCFANRASAFTSSSSMGLPLVTSLVFIELRTGTDRFGNSESRRRALYYGERVV
ncbi:hypothetical protein KXD40_002024 [Peronospora effusa]|nr:hypothetical protein KXD40_002024 [Peronospora effusa]